MHLRFRIATPASVVLQRDLLGDLAGREKPQHFALSGRQGRLAPSAGLTAVSAVRSSGRRSNASARLPA